MSGDDNNPNKKLRGMNFLQNLLVKGDEDEAAAGNDQQNAAQQQQQLSPTELRRRRLAKLDEMAAKDAAEKESKKAKEEEETGDSKADAPRSPAVEARDSITSGMVADKVERIQSQRDIKPVSPAKKEESSKKASPATAPALATAVQPKKEASPKPAAKPRDLVNDSLVSLLLLSLSQVKPLAATYLPMVAAEVGSTSINVDNIDAVLGGRMYADVNDLEPRPKDSPLRYLLGCFDRFTKVSRQFQSDKNEDVGKALEAAKALLINFTVTYLTEPSMFDSSALARSSNGACDPEHEAIDLLKSMDTSSNFVHMLTLIHSEVVKQDAGKGIVLPILMKLAEDAKKQKAEPAEFIFSQLCFARVDKQGGWGDFIAQVLADEQQIDFSQKKPNMFDPACEGRRFEQDSILAPLFSAIDVEIERGSRPTPSVIDGKRKAISGRLKTLSQGVLHLCRASEFARDEMLKWFERALVLNAERSKERPDKFKVASDTFMNNICSVLLDLCEPFLTNEKSASTLPGLVSEVTTYMASCKAFPADLTMVNDTVAEEDEAGSGKKPKKFKFQTRAFTLTLRAIDLGPIVSYRQLGLMERQLHFVRNDLGEESEQFKAIVALITTIVTFGFEPGFVSNLLSFASLSSRWFACLQLGLTGEVPAWNDRALNADVWKAKLSPKLKAVPDFVVGNVADLYLKIGQHDPSQFDLQGPEKLRSVLDFFILIIGCGDNVLKSAHLRANMGDAIFYTFLPEEAQRNKDNKVRNWPRKGVKESVLETSQVSLVHLVPHLMKLYGDVSVTGYYQVPAHRQLITKILGYLWPIEPHRPAFRTFAETSLSPGEDERNSPFVKLADGILNQTNSNVAESLAKLREIRKTQVDMKNPEVWGSLSDEEKKQREELLDSNEKEVTACLMMANDATDMIAYLSTDSTFVRAFTIDTLLKRLADMLCSILKSLGSRQGAEFKIENPEKYNFTPKKMVQEIFSTLLNCARVREGQEDAARRFVDAVAMSAYYDYELFKQVSQVVRKHDIINDPEQLKRFEEFVESCKEAKDKLEEEEADLGEVPDEYLDPLKSTLMTDPVFLPGSKMTVDRQTILQHLLQNQTDPFDRSPLEESQVQDNLELKAEIQKWKADALQKRRGGE